MHQISTNAPGCSLIGNMAQNLTFLVMVALACAFVWNALPTHLLCALA